MKRLYSATTKCTYLSGVHSSIPSDAVEISDDIYQSVIANPAPGKILSHDAGGLPILVDPPTPLPPSRDKIEAARLRAYADPLTGSDRYFAEAQRESLMGNAEAANIATALGLARFAEIQTANPWPEA